MLISGVLLCVRSFKIVQVLFRYLKNVALLSKTIFEEEKCNNLRFFIKKSLLFINILMRFVQNNQNTITDFTKTNKITPFFITMSNFH